MSGAFYPLGMKTYNNHVHQGGYKTWKGNGILSNPTGIAPTHIRPFTNKDYGNVFDTGFGLPRPIKHYRKGYAVGVPIMATSPADTAYVAQVNYNIGRGVKSSMGESLGGGGGGRGLGDELLSSPGGYIMKQNTSEYVNGATEIAENCKTCKGVAVVGSYYPNNTYITNNPTPSTESYQFCCNEQKKALKRVIYASTNLKKNYYTTTYQYLQSRCKTIDQQSFNFNKVGNNVAGKPGSASTTDNVYTANCQPNIEIYDATVENLTLNLSAYMVTKGIITQDQYNTYIALKEYTLVTLLSYISQLPDINKIPALEAYYAFISNPYLGVPLSGPSNFNGCKLVVYKPNNPTFATQGAVSSSARTLQLTVQTIDKSGTKQNKYNSMYKKTPPNCGNTCKGLSVV